MINTLLIFGTKSFNNSLNEIKEYLDFSIVYFKSDFSDILPSTINGVLVDNNICTDLNILKLINHINDKPLLLIDIPKVFNKCKYTDKISSPFSLFDLNKKIVDLLTASKFFKNSSIKIKEYIMDKNEKKLKRDIQSISLTEKEIHLIELLFNEKKPLSKNIILKKAWQYSDNADTHTVETHIYRLRKKILNKFNDQSFIINSKMGYLI
jgi:two-component SAPR family response regulator